MKLETSWLLEKSYKGSIYDQLRVEGNYLTKLGRDTIISYVAGLSGLDPDLSQPFPFTPLFDATNAFIAVGDGTGAGHVNTLGLLGANQVHKGMDVGFPVLNTPGHIAWRATFGVGEAVFAWNEVGIFNGPKVQNEIQSFTFGLAAGAPSDPTGGTWFLNGPDVYTDPLAFDVDAATFQANLDLNNGTGLVATKNGQGDYTVEFASNGWENFNYALQTADGASLTGPDAPYTVTVGTVQDGASQVQNLNRKVNVFGSKPSGDIWHMTVTLGIS